MPSEKSSAKAIFLSSRAFGEKVERYFAEHLPESKEIADVESLCCYLGVSRRRLFELAKEKRYADIVENALCRIAAQKKQLAFRGGIRYSALISRTTTAIPTSRSTPCPTRPSF